MLIDARAALMLGILLDDADDAICSFAFSRVSPGRNVVKAASNSGDTSPFEKILLQM
jgi:hypothetical protein